MRVSTPGVVDHDVEPPVGGDRRVDHPLQVLDFRDVRLHRGGRLTKVGDLALEVLRGLRVGDVVDDDTRTLLRQSQHHRLADARVASGHDCDLALQFVSHVHLPGAPAEGAVSSERPTVPSGTTESDR